MLVCLHPVRTVEICFGWVNGKPVDNYTFKRRMRNDAGVTLGDFVKHMRMELNEAEYRASHFAPSIGLQD
jgi:hypothetical protein